MASKPFTVLVIAHPGHQKLSLYQGMGRRDKALLSRYGLAVKELAEGKGVLVFVASAAEQFSLASWWKHLSKLKNDKEYFASEKSMAEKVIGRELGGEEFLALCRAQKEKIGRFVSRLESFRAFARQLLGKRFKEFRATPNKPELSVFFRENGVFRKPGGVRLAGMGENLDQCVDNFLGLAESVLEAHQVKVVERVLDASAGKFLAERARLTPWKPPASKIINRGKRKQKQASKPGPKPRRPRK